MARVSENSLEGIYGRMIDFMGSYFRCSFKSPGALHELQHERSRHVILAEILLCYCG